MVKQSKYGEDRVRRALYVASVEHDSLVVCGRREEPSDDLRQDMADERRKELAMGH